MHDWRFTGSAVACDEKGLAKPAGPIYLSTKMKTTASSSPARPRTAGLTTSDRKADAALKLWVALARSFNAVSARLAEDIARHELTQTEFAILEVLYHKGPLLLGEVQRKILVTSGGITYLVDRLVEKGLVKREECPEDRRARYAVLTPAGSALIRKIFPEHTVAIERALSGLTLAEQREAAQLLKKLRLAAAAGETGK
jgi:MarR family transcriptional regulator, 2-MHQ and catechol-resistance regulon repressor